MADANCIDWGESAAEEDAEESVCDNNTLYQLGTGDLGTVKGSVCTTLAELITAWSAYTITTNDAYTSLGTADMLSSIGIVGNMRTGIGL